MNYEKELETMGKGAGNVFKPQKAQHKVFIVTEPIETTFKAEDGADYVIPIEMMK